jgi:hypothetical protein
VANRTPVVRDAQLLFQNGRATVRLPTTYHCRPDTQRPFSLSLSPSGSHLPPSSDHRLTIRPTDRLTSLHASRSIRQRDVTCLALVYLAFTRLAACRTGVWYRRAVLTARGSNHPDQTPSVDKTRARALRPGAPQKTHPCPKLTQAPQFSTSLSTSLHSNPILNQSANEFN